MPFHLKRANETHTLHKPSTSKIKKWPASIAHSKNTWNFGFMGHRFSEQERTFADCMQLSDVTLQMETLKQGDLAWLEPVVGQAGKDDALSKNASIKSVISKPQTHSITRGWPAWCPRFTSLLFLPHRHRCWASILLSSASLGSQTHAHQCSWPHQPQWPNQMSINWYISRRDES